MRHEAEDTAVVRSDARYIFESAIWICGHIEMLGGFPLHVFERDGSVLLELCERFGRSEVFSLSVRYRHRERFDAFEPWALTRHLQVHPAAGVASGIVGEQGARPKPRSEERRVGEEGRSR